MVVPIGRVLDVEEDVCLLGKDDPLTDLHDAMLGSSRRRNKAVTQVSGGKSLQS